MNYLSEPSLNSELILVNNAKLLKKNKKLFCDKHLDRIMDLRDQYERLNQDNSLGIQTQKRKIRDEIRELSAKTYVDRDTNLFGEMIIQVMDKLLTRPNFVNYNYKNEMKSLATEYILKYTWKFDPFKQSKINGQYVSAFTYITTIAFNAFVATINRVNKENRKIKEDFLETQKLFHNDPNHSTYGEEYSLPKKEVVLNHIDNSLFEVLQKIPLDEKDIQIFYPDEYKISLDEFEKITGYSKDNNLSLFINPLSTKPKSLGK